MANAGLPIFLLLTGFTVAQAARRRPLAQYVEERARRLLVPFAAGYALYCVEQLAIRREAALQRLATITPLDVLYGPAVHLWFLLFAFIASSAAAVALRASALSPGRASFGAINSRPLARRHSSITTRERWRRSDVHPRWR